MTATPRTRPSLGGRMVHALCVAVMALSLAFLLPSAFGLERYVITGGSMSGTFEVGAVALEEKVPVEDLRVGDVITYSPPAESGIDTLVTHRIVSIDDGTFRTQGDANPDVDPWTFRLDADTQPRVVFTVPWVGHFFLFLADRENRMALIGVPAAFVALLSLRDLLRAVRRPTAAPLAGAEG